MAADGEAPKALPDLPPDAGASPAPPEHPVPSSRVRPLERSLFHGVAWNAALKWPAQLLSWITTIWMARLLLPRDFGVVGMATVFIGLTTIVTEFGIGSAILVYRDMRDSTVAQLNALSLMLGVAGFVVCCIAAWPLSLFYHEPALRMVMVGLGGTFVVDSFRSVPAALLQRELRFREFAILESTKQIAGSLLGVVLAASGWGYWSLVVGNLAGSIIWTLAMLERRRSRFAWPRLTELRPYLQFNRQVITERIAWYGYSSSDFIVAGRLLGTEPLGVYTYAWTLANLPGEKILVLLQRVLPSIYSAAQSDQGALRRYFLLATESLSLVVIPVTVGLALVAEDFVVVVLGRQWIATIPILRILCIAMTAHMMSTLLPQLLLMVGQARLMMRLSIGALALMPLSFYLAGDRWGAIGIATIWLTVYPFVLSVLYFRAFRIIAMPYAVYLESLWPALSGTLAMAVAVLAGRGAFLDALSPVLRLVAETTLGAAVYIATLAVFHRDRLLQLRAITRAS